MLDYPFEMLDVVQPDCYAIKPGCLIKNIFGVRHGTYPEAELERLKADVSLVRLIEEAGIKLARRGKDFVASCPFHAEDTASLMVTPEKNLFHCFGCGVAGGPIDWVMKRNGVSFRHAIELLREGLPAVTESTVKRTTMRALPPPVSFDADEPGAAESGGRLLS